MFLLTALCCSIFATAQGKKPSETIQKLAYDEITLNDIKRTSLRSDQAFSLARDRSDPLVFAYRTNEGRYGKFELLSHMPTMIHIRWTTYNADGTVYRGGGANLSVPIGVGCDLDLGSAEGVEGTDFIWVNRQTRDPYRLEPRYGAGFSRYVLSNQVETDNKTEDPNPDKSNPAGKEASVKTNPGKTENPQVDNATKIVWNYPISNHTTTNTPTLALKACVETTEPIKEYILVQNGQRSFTARGLIVQQANDCFNAYNKTVTLKTGDNQFQLIAQSNAGELQSEVFTITYDPNATTSNPRSNATSQRRLALVIGNAAYPTAGLKNPVNDATDIATALRAMGFEVISATNANRLKMNTAIDDFGSRLKDYDLGFFYYAGHGLQVKGENYLVPIDATPKSQGEVEYDCYPVGKILAKMEDAANRANIIVLDACRDNPLQRSWSRSTGSNGLANINAPQGTFIGFATSPGSTAADGTGRNGVYTGALLEHIRKPNLTVDQLFNFVNGTVKKLTNNLQIPWKASSMSEDLYLTK
ncbi:peptidase C14 caspase catalytic subunit p20 [Haliscomenobacter hydrossis DSM 1100]|uniref:Peptidase C14 caspase catalytic subunit p20 n=1 Tax=Haliscomenobacter hydrossis (strain ATCC 27775 / DSM 1100 / LMG 10767 / O) TaxID=760192 RepID=F4KUX8_HALH1|nr:peptidase C14 caspase catalytic subunit p20 [Haliscomenobacter hydrossis DSM 1100]